MARPCAARALTCRTRRPVSFSCGERHRANDRARRPSRGAPTHGGGGPPTRRM